MFRAAMLPEQLKHAGVRVHGSAVIGPAALRKHHGKPVPLRPGTQPRLPVAWKDAHIADPGPARFWIDLGHHQCGHFPLETSDMNAVRS